jgi:predicted Zn-dependent protease with MMP-like domain
MFRRRQRTLDPLNAAEERLERAEAALDDDDPRRALRLADDAMRIARSAGEDDLCAAALTTSAAAWRGMNRFADALIRAEEACDLRDGNWATHYERGVALYRLARFDEAAKAFDIAAHRNSDAAQPWHALGRCAVWLGDMRRARSAFSRAATLEPEEYVAPVRIAAAEFDRIAAEALRGVPAPFRGRLGNAFVVVEPLPDPDEVAAGFDPDTLGVYEGATTLDDDGGERIVLYQYNHETVCGSLSALENEVRGTILHEVGHHFGMDEDELPF